MKKNPLDEKHKIEGEYADTKKNVCGFIRKAAKGKIGDNDEISEELFKLFTDPQEIEKLVFDVLLNNKEQNEKLGLFVVRLYVVKQIAETMGEKFKNWLASFSTPLGATHLAVQINDKILHWYDSGMVLVQPFEGSNATALFYPQNERGESCPVIENTPENRKKLVDIILRYNCKEKYDIGKCNCQHFAQDIFGALGLSSDFAKYDGPVGDYLKYIMKGKCGDDIVCLVNSKGQVMEQNKKKLVWKTHEDLDKWAFTEENKKTYEKFAPLLKAFHRGFQAQEKSNRNKDIEGVYDSKKCQEGLPTLLQNSLVQRMEISPFDVETNYTFKGLSGITSGIDSGAISGNKN